MACLEKGARRELKTAEFMGGNTALHLAMRAGHVAVGRALFAAGCKRSAANKHGWSPLHSAAAAGQRAAVEFLVSQGANVALRNKAGGTPLHVAGP